MNCTVTFIKKLENGAGEKFSDMFSHFDTVGLHECDRQTDRQTDGRTDGLSGHNICRAYTCLSLIHI